MQSTTTKPQKLKHHSKSNKIIKSTLKSTQSNTISNITRHKKYQPTRSFASNSRINDFAQQFQQQLQSELQSKLDQQLQQNKPIGYTIPFLEHCMPNDQIIKCYIPTRLKPRRTTNTTSSQLIELQELWSSPSSQRDELIRNMVHNGYISDMHFKAIFQNKVFIDTTTFNGQELYHTSLPCYNTRFFFPKRLQLDVDYEILFNMNQNQQQLYEHFYHIEIRTIEHTLSPIHIQTNISFVTDGCNYTPLLRTDSKESVQIFDYNNQLSSSQLTFEAEVFDQLFATKLRECLITDTNQGPKHNNNNNIIVNSDGYIDLDDNFDNDDNNDEDSTVTDVVNVINSDISSITTKSHNHLHQTNNNNDIDIAKLNIYDYVTNDISTSILGSIFQQQFTITGKHTTSTDDTIEGWLVRMRASMQNKNDFFGDMLFLLVI